VEVQTLFYGSDWITNATYHNQASYLGNYLQMLVHSSYMDMLTKAGHKVGRGTRGFGVAEGVNLNHAQQLPDSRLRSAIQAAIYARVLPSPNSNSLYVVYVEDNVVVNFNGATSQRNLGGYHTAVAGHTATEKVRKKKKKKGDIHLIPLHRRGIR
jgi:hypothetical protein